MTPSTRSRSLVADDAGFTLVELMVTVLIIGILIAIALPTFLGARARAAERSAQSLLRTAHTAAKVSYTDNGNFSSVSPASLAAIDTSVAFTTGPAANGEVSVRDVGTSTVLLVSASSTGDVFCIAEDSTAGLLYRGSDGADSFVGVADCNAGSW